MRGLPNIFIIGLHPQGKDGPAWVTDHVKMELKTSPSHAYVGTETTHKKPEEKYMHGWMVCMEEALLVTTQAKCRTDKSPTFYNMTPPPQRLDASLPSPFLLLLVTTPA